MNTLQIVCLALLGLLVFVLGANVTRHRAIRGKSGGNQQPTDPADRMLIAIRAHGNAAEYVPTLAVLILVCATLSDGWWVDALAVAAVVARYLHAFGMLTCEDPGRPRPGPRRRGRWAPTSPASRWRSPRSRRCSRVDRRPIIGIAGAGYVVPRFWGELPVRGVPTSYVDAVAAAGGRPVILPPGHAVDLLDVVDAVVLAGGDDIGADPAQGQGRDRAGAGRARARELPLLGVCRGLQLLAVADGGSLVADLGPDLPHVRPEVGHPVDVATGSVLGALLGSGTVVSSLHHQGVATLGADWRATAWSADGLVEGAEWGDRTRRRPVAPGARRERARVVRLVDGDGRSGRSLKRAEVVARPRGKADVAREPLRSAPMPAATTSPMPSTASRFGDLVQRDEPDDERERRLQRHQRPEGAGGETAQGEQLQGERHDRQQDREAEPDRAAARE